LTWKFFNGKSGEGCVFVSASIDGGASFACAAHWPCHFAGIFMKAASFFLFACDSAFFAMYGARRLCGRKGTEPRKEQGKQNKYDT